MNERDEQQVGAALGRAVESQRVSETPFERSRLAAELEHPRGALFPVFRLAAAFAVVVLAAGALYVASLPSGIGPGKPTPSPSGSAPVVVPSTTPAPVGTPLPGRLNHSVVYCARVNAPPFAIGVPGITGATPEQRIKQRLEALQRLRPLGPTEDGPCPMGFPSPARVLTVEIKEGALAFVDFDVPGGDWKTSLCLTCPLVQEIVYTVTEEPGVTQALIRQKDGPGLIVNGQGPFAASREDVVGYAFRAEKTFAAGGETSGPATTRWSVDQVAPGLARFVIEVFGAQEPKITVTARQNDEKTDPDFGKWVLDIAVPGANAKAEVEIADRTPLRAIRTMPAVEVTAPGSDARPVTHYFLGLDDLRPWRVSLIPSGPRCDVAPCAGARIVVDLGGPTSWVRPNLAVYTAVGMDNSGRTINLTGAARAFEAHVSWRVKQGGAVVARGSTLASIGTSGYFGTFDTQVKVPANVSGNLTLEVFLVSARDGSDLEVVSVPLTIN